MEVKAVKKKLIIVLASLAVVGAAVAGFLHWSHDRSCQKDAEVLLPEELLLYFPR